MRHVLVIRFGALGDLCLLARALSRANASAAGDPRRVTLATKAAFAPLLATAAGVDEVVALEDGGLAGLLGLASRLRRRKWDAVIDAHGVLRSHLLTLLLRRRPRARLAKDTTARLRLLAGGAEGSRLTRTMGERFDELLPAITGEATFDFADDPLPFATLRPAGPSRVLGLAPGARWDTKRWPAGHCAELLDLAAAHDVPVRFFLGPQESAWFDASPLAAAATRTGADVVRDRPLADVAAQLAGCAALVTNDSGLLHLAEGTGTPVVALFGPTVRAFGYFPVHPASRVLETGLDCRPCSRNGKRPCHRGDLACLADISAGAVWAAVQALLPATGEENP
ncbi:MAG: glycosyltransferase family 9 protein [bacterium]|nr:glycosyltransferase family 9 protein [bacterium]